MTQRLSVILTDQFYVQPSSQNLPPAANGNKYRCPQTDIMQGVGDLRTLSLKKMLPPYASPKG